MSRESYGGGGQYGGGTSSGNTGGNGGDAREQYGAVGQYGGGTTTRDDGNGQPPTIEPPYVMVGGQKFAVDDPKAIEAQNIVEQESLLGNIVDLYQQYSPVGNILNIGGSILSNIGDASTSLQNKAIAFDLQNRLQKAYQDPTFDPFTPDASVTQLEQDLAKAQAGEFSQSEYQDRYAPQMNQIGDTSGDSERALRTALTPYAPYAITDTTPQESMVNQYFSNLGMSNQPLSSNLQTDYNNAKTTINSLLGNIPSPSQQFGYGLLNTQNINNQNYIDYLRNAGLI